MLDRQSPFDTTVRFEAGKLADFAHARLRDAFVRCDIEPGAVITESAMARRLGLGKAPVRTALARLEAEGWVEPAARRGYLVAPITLGSIRDIFEMRRALEPLLAQATPTASDAAEIGRQRDMAAALRPAPSTAAKSSALAAAREVRALMLQATGNRLLQTTLPRLWDLSDRLDHFLERAGRTAPRSDYWAEFGAFADADDAAAMASAIEDALAASQEAVEREFLAFSRDLPIVAPAQATAAPKPSANPARPPPSDGRQPFEPLTTNPQHPRKN